MPPMPRRQAAAMSSAMPATTGPPKSAAMASTTERVSKKMPGSSTIGLTMPRMQKLPNSIPAETWLRKPCSLHALMLAL